MTPDEAAKSKKLASIFRRLGADDPESWAESEVEEGIPQLGLFVFLKQAWQNIIDESRPDEWFDKVAEYGKDDPDSHWGQLSRAIDVVLASGVTREQLATLVQLLQYDMLNTMCFQLDDGGYESDINVQDGEEWPPVRWSLQLVDDDGNVKDSLDGLHEYSDGEPSNGRQSGFR